MLEVLGIMGSPRLEGNTDLLLDEALKGAESQGARVDKLVVDKLKVTACQEYYRCLRDGNCVIRDDMDRIYARLLGADVVIVASPMFFYGLTGQLKVLIDRCQATWVRKHVLKQELGSPGRKGAFIGVGATSGAKLFEGSVLVVKYFFGAIGVSYSGERLVRGVDKKGEIRQHPGALEEAFALGKLLVTG